MFSIKYALAFYVLYEVLFFHGIIVVSDCFSIKTITTKVILDLWKRQKRSLISLIVCTIIIYIILFIAFIPFRLIIWLISLAYTFAPSVTEWLENVSSARVLLYKLLSFIPLLAVFVMNNVLGISIICLQFSNNILSCNCHNFSFSFLKQGTTNYSSLFSHLLIHH